MTRYVVDPSAVLHLLAEDITVSDDHQLVAPTLIRSQILSELYGAVRRGEMTEDEALKRHERFGKMKIRLLGDAVLRRNAWKIAAQMGWESTFDAEYVALTRLQADALVTMDEELERAIDGVIETAHIEDLTS